MTRRSEPTSGAGRLVALGCAPVGVTWLRDVARWASTGALPAELVRCVGADDLSDRLAEGRRWSVLVVDLATPGVDRDLIGEATSIGVPVIGVRSPVAPPSPVDPDLTIVIAPPTDARSLGDLLDEVGRPLPRVDASTPEVISASATEPMGRLVTVTGAGGAGASVLSMALAQGLGSTEAPDEVLLADLCLDAELGMLHDAVDVVPGLHELIEAHGVGRPPVDRIDELTWGSIERGHRLLLGLRRHRDWTVVRPRALDAALDGLLARHRIVVADVDADVEGRALTGSADVEDRNRLARTAHRRADLVVVVGGATAHHVHGLARVIDDLLALGIEAERVLPVINRAPGRARARAALAAAVAELVAHRVGAPVGLASPVHVVSERALEASVLDPRPFPRRFAGPLVAAVGARLEALSPNPGAIEEAVPVAPGSLGRLD